MDIISQKPKKNNTPEFLPHLKGLKGGEKQAYLNANRETIAAMAGILSFDELCELFHSTPATMASTLKKAEGRNRPAITQADKAMLEARQASNKASEVLGELSVQSSALAALSSEVDDMVENFARYFDMMAQANSVMSKMMKRQSRYRSLRNIYLARTGTKSQQLLKKTRKSSAISSRKAARLLLSTPGSSRLPGQVVKGESHRHYSRRKGKQERWPYV